MKGWKRLSMIWLPFAAVISDGIKIFKMRRINNHCKNPLGRRRFNDLVKASIVWLHLRCRHRPMWTWLCWNAQSFDVFWFVGKWSMIRFNCAASEGTDRINGYNRYWRSHNQLVVFSSFDTAVEWRWFLRRDWIAASSILHVILSICCCCSVGWLGSLL